ncbi:MAG TPA: hypothetical protein VGK37_10870 [Casimicrobiaceae bacterium]|jgi:hypothetical protein
MMVRPFLFTSIAALALVAPCATAQTPAPANPAPQATAASSVKVPPNNCVKPEFPGALASNSRIVTFNKEVAAYGDCIKKYIGEVKDIALAATTAGNGAIDEYNAYMADLKAKVEASK